MAFKDKTQLPLDLFAHPNPTFENFYVGDNQAAVETLRKVGEGVGPQIVYIYGEVGAGCTHLLRALGTETDVLEFSEDRKLYIVDDIEQKDEQSLHKVFDLINQVRARPDCSIVIAGHSSPEELAMWGMRKDVTSRLSWGAVFEIKPLSAQKKREEFLKRVAHQGLTVSPEVLSWMDNYLPRDMHSLARILSAAAKLSLAQNRPITIPLLKECLAGAKNEE